VSVAGRPAPDAAHSLPDIVFYFMNTQHSRLTFSSDSIPSTKQAEAAPGAIIPATGHGVLRWYKQGVFPAVFRLSGANGIATVTASAGDQGRGRCTARHRQCSIRLSAPPPLLVARRVCTPEGSPPPQQPLDSRSAVSIGRSPTPHRCFHYRVLERFESRASPHSPGPPGIPVSASCSGTPSHTRSVLSPMTKGFSSPLGRASS
jgi:hypothetical protein